MLVRYVNSHLVARVCQEFIRCVLDKNIHQGSEPYDLDVVDSKKDTLQVSLCGMYQVWSELIQ